MYLPKIRHYQVLVNKFFLDEYHSKIIDYFKQVNDITGNIDFDNLNQYPVVEMIKERYDYIVNM